MDLPASFRSRSRTIRYPGSGGVWNHGYACFLVAYRGTRHINPVCNLVADRFLTNSAFRIHQFPTVGRTQRIRHPNCKVGVACSTDGDVPIGWPQLGTEVNYVGNLSRVDVDGSRLFSQYATTNYLRVRPTPQDPATECAAQPGDGSRKSPRYQSPQPRSCPGRALGRCY